MKKSSFTLIELLVVVGIIGILLGILLPAISSAMREGKKTSAQAMCRQIELACVAYRADYQSNVTNQSGEINFNDVRKILRSVSASEAALGNVNNPRNKEYFSAVRDVTNPWGSAYFVVFDTNYDNQIDTPYGVFPGSVVAYTIDRSGQVISGSK